MAKKITIWIIVVLLLAGLVFVALTILSEKKNTDDIVKNQTAETSLLGEELAKNLIEIDDATLVANESLNLSFKAPCMLEKIFIKEGETARAGDAIVKAKTSELELQKKQLEAALVQAKANLNKLMAGAAPEDLKIFESQKQAAKKSYSAYKGGMIDILRAGFTAADDSVRGKTNQLYSDPDGDSPQLLFSFSDSALEEDIENGKAELGDDLDSFKNRVDDLNESSDFDDEVDHAKNVLEDVQDYLDNVSRAVNVLVDGQDGLDQETIDYWRASVSAARAAADTARAGIADAYGSLRGASGSYSLAKDQYTYKSANPRADDITIADARVSEAESQLGIVNEKLKEAAIIAPHDGKVAKIWLKENENTGAGQTIVSFDTFEQKVRAEVPEEDIQNVRIGSGATIRFKAVAGTPFSGKVESIEPHETIRDGDVYYRVYLELSGNNSQLRSGMTADVEIDY